MGSGERFPNAKPIAQKMGFNEKYRSVLFEFGAAEVGLADEGFSDQQNLPSGITFEGDAECWGRKSGSLISDGDEFTRTKVGQLSDNFGGRVRVSQGVIGRFKSPLR